MRNYSQQEITEQFNKLPEDLKAAISGADMPQTLRKIGQAHHLHIDQLGTLVNIVKLTLAGFIKARDFVETLKEALNADDQTVQSVASAVNAKIFLPLRNSMRTVSKDYPEDRYAPAEGASDKNTPPEPVTKTAEGASLNPSIGLDGAGPA